MMSGKGGLNQLFELKETAQDHAMWMSDMKHDESHEAARRQ